MKKIKIFLLIILSFIILIPTYVKANKNETINIYLVYSDTCSHCQKALKYLNTLNNDNVKVYTYLLDNSINEIKIIQESLKKNLVTVPWIIIGNKTFTGWIDSSSPNLIQSTIKYYQNNSYEDIVGIKLGLRENKNEEIKPETSEENDYNIKFIKNINLKNLSLPVLSILLGIIDGFNPCAMWVLLFLITMLINMKDRKKMWILGISFLLTSTLVYLLFMVSWLNLLSYVNKIAFIRFIISLVAITAGALNISNYLKTRKISGCTVVDEKKRKYIFQKIKDIVKEKKFILALLGIITLAVLVNLVEIACSLGLPVIFMQILSINNLTTFQTSIYIGLYLLMFMLDDLIVFIISMTALRVTGLSTKYTKYTHLIGGIIMILIGLLLVLKPEWLSFT